jgi:uncharacterized protein (TIGR00106 family)
MLAEFSMYPLDGVHMSKDVAKAIDILESAGLPYQLGPMGTSIEGDWDDVLPVIRRCHLAVAKDHGRVITTIVIDDRKNQPHALKEMVSSVDQHLAAKHARKSKIDMQS